MLIEVPGLGTIKLLKKLLYGCGVFFSSMSRNLRRLIIIVVWSRDACVADQTGRTHTRFLRWQLFFATPAGPRSALSSCAMYKLAETFVAHRRVSKPLEKTMSCVPPDPNVSLMPNVLYQFHKPTPRRTTPADAGTFNLAERGRNHANFKACRRPPRAALQAPRHQLPPINRHASAFMSQQPPRHHPPPGQASRPRWSNPSSRSGLPPSSAPASVCLSGEPPLWCPVLALPRQRAAGFPLFGIR